MSPAHSLPKQDLSEITGHIEKMRICFPEQNLNSGAPGRRATLDLGIKFKSPVRHKDDFKNKILEKKNLNLV